MNSWVFAIEFGHEGAVLNAFPELDSSTIAVPCGHLVYM